MDMIFLVLIVGAIAVPAGIEIFRNGRQIGGFNCTVNDDTDFSVRPEYLDPTSPLYMNPHE